MTKNTRTGNRLFVRLFYGSLILIFAVTLLSFIFRLGLSYWLPTAAVVVTIAALAVKLWSDNRHLRISFSELASLLGAAFICWLPFCVILLPGVMCSHWLDTQLERGIVWTEMQSSDKFKEVIDTNERDIIESGTVWWNPFTWGSQVTRSIRETTVRNVIEKASLAKRAFYGFIYAVLRGAQYVYLVCLALVVVRSYGYVLARTAVRRGKGLDFMLPLTH